MSKHKTAEFFRRIFWNFYAKNILIALGIVLGILLVFFIFLNIFTRHGQSFPVPDFRGMSQYEVLTIAQEKHLRIEVTDSVYIITRRPGSIIEQNPAAGTQVKQNRRVLITVNAKNPIKVEMPDIIGYTLRQAKAILEQQGLEVGYLSFTPDIAINNVLGQKFHGKNIDFGTLIAKGSKIDLVLGKGMQNEKTGLPLLTGLTLSEAKSRITDASLNIGQFKFDETIKDFKDSLDARVYSQYPAYTEPNTIYFGARVDLWLTLNQSRIPVIDGRAAIDSTYLKIDTTQMEDEIIE